MNSHNTAYTSFSICPGKPLTPQQVVRETENAISAASGPTLLCCDGDGHVLTVSWTLFEIWYTGYRKGGQNLRVMCAEVMTPGHVLGVLKQVIHAIIIDGQLPDSSLAFVSHKSRAPDVLLL